MDSWADSREVGCEYEFRALGAEADEDTITPGDPAIASPTHFTPASLTSRKLTMSSPGFLLSAGRGNWVTNASWLWSVLMRSVQVQSAMKTVLSKGASAHFELEGFRLGEKGGAHVASEVVS